LLPQACAGQNSTLSSVKTTLISGVFREKKQRLDVVRAVHRIYQ
jgi:hypothetical protein